MPQFWSAILTKRGNETQAQANVRAQGFVTYFPRISDHKPLFPRFFFVRQNALFEDRWPVLRNTRGCQGPLMSGDVPGKVRHTEIKRMKDQEHKGVIQLPLSFVPGQSLRVNAPSHLLHDHLVVFEGMVGKARAQVLWALFGTMSVATIDMSVLEAA
jgi:transcription antitermination factor NusG